MAATAKIWTVLRHSVFDRIQFGTLFAWKKSSRYGNSGDAPGSRVRDSLVWGRLRALSPVVSSIFPRTLDVDHGSKSAKLDESDCGDLCCMCGAYKRHRSTKRGGPTLSSGNRKSSKRADASSERRK